VLVPLALQELALLVLSHLLAALLDHTTHSSSSRSFSAGRWIGAQEPQVKQRGTGSVRELGA
jgi:hypothetical protein